MHPTYRSACWRRLSGAANESEVAQKVISADRDWDLVRALLVSYDIRIEPTVDDAEWAV